MYEYGRGAPAAAAGDRGSGHRVTAAAASGGDGAPGDGLWRLAPDCGRSPEAGGHRGGLGGLHAHHAHHSLWWRDPCALHAFEGLWWLAPSAAAPTGDPTSAAAPNAGDHWWHAPTRCTACCASALLDGWLPPHRRPCCVSELPRGAAIEDGQPFWVVTCGNYCSCVQFTCDVLERFHSSSMYFK